VAVAVVQVFWQGWLAVVVWMHAVKVDWGGAVGERHGHVQQAREAASRRARYPVRDEHLTALVATGTKSYDLLRLRIMVVAAGKRLSGLAPSLECTKFPALRLPVCTSPLDPLLPCRQISAASLSLHRPCLSSDSLRLRGQEAETVARSSVMHFPVATYFGCCQ
jgi:hypothetical protein